MATAHSHCHRTSEQAEKLVSASCSFKMSPIAPRRLQVGRSTTFCQQVVLKNQFGNFSLKGEFSNRTWFITALSNCSLFCVFKHLDIFPTIFFHLFFGGFVFFVLVFVFFFKESIIFWKAVTWCNSLRIYSVFINMSTALFWLKDAVTFTRIGHFLWGIYYRCKNWLQPGI